MSTILLNETNQNLRIHIRLLHMDEVAQRLGVEMPLCEQVYRVLYQGLPPREGVKQLMARAIKAETG